MKFTTLFLADAATINDGLISALNGGINSLGRGGFPSPMGVSLVAIAELSEDYVNDQELLVEFSVSSADDTDVFARFGGIITTSFPEETDPRARATPIVIDLSGVTLTRPGVYKITAQPPDNDSQHLFFEVHQLGVQG